MPPSVSAAPGPTVREPLMNGYGRIAKGPIRCRGHGSDDSHQATRASSHMDVSVLLF